MSTINKAYRCRYADGKKLFFALKKGNQGGYMKVWVVFALIIFGFTVVAGIYELHWAWGFPWGCIAMIISMAICGEFSKESHPDDRS